MRFIGIEEFKNRELHNQEKYLLVFNMGGPLTVAERQNIINQVVGETDRFQIADEWLDAHYRYYMEIEIVNNLIFGLAVVLVLSSVFVFVVGRSLSDILSQIGVVSHKAVPLALIGLVAVGLIVGYRWLRVKRKT